MAANKLLILACAITLSGLSAGCIGGGDADTADAASSGKRTRASRGILSFGKKKDRTAEREQTARANAAALDGYTPESSMARDMARLQEQERAQALLVAELAGTRGADPEKFSQEQERLFTLRDKIQNYDTALQRFEMAARTRPARDAEVPPAVVPAEMFEDRAVVPASFGQPGDYGTYQASRGEDRLDDYSRVTHARVNLNEGYADREEEVLYRAEGNDNLAAMYANTGTLPGLNTNAYTPPQPPAQAPAGPTPTRFAGAPVGRSNFSKTPRFARAEAEAAPEVRPAKADKPWEGGHLFDAQAAREVKKQKTEVPNIYASRPQREEQTLWPAGMAMVPPAGTENTLRPSPKTEVRLTGAPEELRPAAPKTLTGAPTPAKAPAPAVPDDDVLDDEVFSPSMFLGAGL